MIERETQLWQWLLFGSKLKPTEIKRLLLAWEESGLSAEQALPNIERSAAQWGLSRPDAAMLARIPAQLKEHPAVRWNDSRYPEGLLRLDPAKRPALLFTRGDADILVKPFIFLLPGVILDRSQELTLEAIGLLLGGEFTVAAFTGTPQAELLQTEMQWSEGNAVIFATSGLDKHESDVIEKEYIDQGRLVLLSPLPAAAAENPKWLPLLYSIATTGAKGVIATIECRDAVMGVDAETKVLWLAEEPLKAPKHPQINASDMAAEVLVWSEDLLPRDPLPEPFIPNMSQYVDTDRAIDDVELGPPPSTEQVLDTLSKGGTIPQALLDRLRGEA